MSGTSISLVRLSTEDCEYLAEGQACGSATPKRARVDTPRLQGCKFEVSTRQPKSDLQDITMLRALVGLALAWSSNGFIACKPQCPGAPTRLLYAAAWDMELFSPAKINLFLRVLRKRDDGYHELASLFQTIDLGDTLKVRALPPSATADKFECDLPGLGADNLVTRAFALYRKKTGFSTHFEARLEKHTPVEAGLGGGSSNAATALYAANCLCRGAAASEDELIEMSADLGSDITFFLGPTGTAYCTGRGEIIQPLDPLPNRQLFVVKPDMGLSTPLVFKQLGQSNYEQLSAVDPTDLLDNFVHGPGPADYINDLEPPAFQLKPVLADLKSKLLQHFPIALMSGSGTSLFAVQSKDQTPDPLFPFAFQKECAEELGIKVKVFEVFFVSRQSHTSWYQHP